MRNPLSDSVTNICVDKVKVYLVSETPNKERTVTFLFIWLFLNEKFSFLGLLGKTRSRGR